MAFWDVFFVIFCIPFETIFQFLLSFSYNGHWHAFERNIPKFINKSKISRL